MLAAVILSGGASRRMGTPKALLPYRAGTFLEHLLSVTDHPRIGWRRVVLGADAHAIAEGVIDVTPMITGEVSLDGVDATFDELSDPNRHCKIVVTP